MNILPSQILFRWWQWQKTFRYICRMSDLTTIKRILTQLKPELIDKYHVSSIGLFGSVVRDDFTPSSDIDIIVDFSKPIGIEFVDLADYIEMKLQKSVDLVSKKGIKQKYYRAIESEIIYV
jgi:predicted nucleotidyltransferase